MHTFRKLPKASPKRKIEDAKTGSTWSLDELAEAPARTARASPEERYDSLFLIELYGDYAGWTKVLKSLAEWPRGDKAFAKSSLRLVRQGLSEPEVSEV